MKALPHWIDDRTGLVAATRQRSQSTLPGGARWWKIWPSMIVFTFAVEAVTGLFLWMFYSPSAQTAWESVYYLQYEVPGGWLLRGVHHYAAQVLVGLIGVYLLGMIFFGIYRAPREFVFWVVLLMGMVSLGLCLTGDLLAWDQNSYASTSVRTRFLLLLPGVGGHLFKLAVGGPSFGHLTLTRFFALHAGLFAAIFFALIVLRERFARRAATTEAAGAGRAGWYWPNQAALNMIGCLFVLVVVGLLVVENAFTGEHAGQPPGDYLGVALGAPADLDPANFYAAARPEWSFRGLYQLSNLFTGERKIVPIFVIPGCLVLVFVAMPIVARSWVGHCGNVVLTAALLVAIVYLTVLSYQHDLKSPEHQAALADGLAEARRVKELVRASQGIPPTGALSLLRDDPKTQGPKLYEQHCATCHRYTDSEGNVFEAEESSGPNLTGFSSGEWLAGLLDPRQVAGPGYFGNTKFKDGSMVDFVKGTLKELRDEDEIGEEPLEELIACLAAESELQSPRETDDEQVKGIDEDTMFLFGDFTCTDCHRFYTEGDLGEAPDLTGYGSRRWLMGIISDPTHQRFYGGRNDRMPAYHLSPEEATLTARQIEMLADWLRREWYEPDAKLESAPEGNAAE